MKKFVILTSLFISLASFSIFSQPPNAFSYQAVARDQTGQIIANQNVTLKISILTGSVDGVPVYIETHSTQTNQFGLINLQIGNGTKVSGDFAIIDWGSYSYFLKVEMDETGGTDYKHMGTTQLLSVPYALYAKNAENVDDADADPSNELITNVFLNGTTLHIKDTNEKTIDLSSLTGTDDQNLILTGNILSIKDGQGTVDLSKYVNDEDADSLNELIKDIKLNGTILTIIESGKVDTINLASIGGADDQNLVMTGNVLSIEGGEGTVDLGQYIDDADADSTNELISIVFLDGTVLHIKDANEKTADLSSLTGADDQNLLIDGDVLSIEDGQGSVDLSQYINDNDADPTNEIQMLLIDGDSLKISGGNSVFFISETDNDSDSTNEIQDLKLTGNVLTITLKPSPTQADLSPYIDNTDNQSLAISNDTISLINGGFIKLPAENDPLFTASTTYGITQNDTATWNAKSEFDGDYNKLTSKPDYSGFLTNEKDSLSEFITDAGNKGISNLANPISDQDASTKAYVDSILEIMHILQSGVTDIDGYHYNVVLIGNQIWMAENLRVTKYPDGTPILSVFPIVGYGGGYRWYEADMDSDGDTDSQDSLYYVNYYGYLYRWTAIMYGYSSSNENPSGVQGVCPDGWHLPSDEEWIELEIYLGMDSATAYGEYNYRGTDQGTQLKQGGITGFNAKMGGFHYGVSAEYYFNGFGTEGCYWTSTIWSGDEAYNRNFWASDSRIGRDTNYAGIYKWNHMSIRCVKDWP